MSFTRADYQWLVEVSRRMRDISDRAVTNATLTKKDRDWMRRTSRELFDKSEGVIGQQMPPLEWK